MQWKRIGMNGRMNDRVWAWPDGSSELDESARPWLFWHFSWRLPCSARVRARLCADAASFSNIRCAWIDGFIPELSGTDDGLCRRPRKVLWTEYNWYPLRVLNMAHFFSCLSTWDELLHCSCPWEPTTLPLSRELQILSCSPCLTRLSDCTIRPTQIRRATIISGDPTITQQAAKPPNIYRRLQMNALLVLFWIDFLRVLTLLRQCTLFRRCQNYYVLILRDVPA